MLLIESFFEFVSVCNPLRSQTAAWRAILLCLVTLTQVFAFMGTQWVISQDHLGKFDTYCVLQTAALALPNIICLMTIYQAYRKKTRNFNFLVKNLLMVGSVMIAATWLFMPQYCGSILAAGSTVPMILMLLAIEFLFFGTVFYHFQP